MCNTSPFETHCVKYQAQKKKKKKPKPKIKTIPQWCGYSNIPILNHYLRRQRKTMKYNEKSWTFVTLWGLMGTLYIFAFSFECRMCDKKFRDLARITRHVRDVHLRVKGFVCRHCGRGFADKRVRNALALALTQFILPVEFLSYLLHMPFLPLSTSSLPFTKLTLEWI